MGSGSEGQANASVLAQAPPAIPDHQLLARIANGSYGEVWLARSTLGAYRAVKIVRRDRFPDPRPYEREYNGIRHFEPVSREHEAFLDILQVGRKEEEGFFYYVMELADGADGQQNGRLKEQVSRVGHSAIASPQPCAGTEPQASSYVPHTLAQEIRQRSPMPVQEVIELGAQLLEGLRYLHEKRLIHRDIKPSNILFVGGKPKLGDVGLVAELGGTLSIVGTMGYMPAEGPGTPQADLYSLGKVLYEAVTGKDRQEFPELPAATGSAEFDLKLLEFNEVLLKACAPRPDKRYPSADAMLADLATLRGGCSLVRARARRRWAVRAAVCAASAAGILLLTSLVWKNTIPDSRVIPRFSDEFEGAQLDTNKWALITTNWCSPGHEDEGGAHTFQHACSQGELVLESSSRHQGGWSTSAAQWIESAQDLFPVGECLVEIEFAADNRNGDTHIMMSDGALTKIPYSAPAVRLFSLPPTLPNQRLRWAKESVLIHLLPDFAAAIVYPRGRWGGYDIVDLQGLKQWRLRFLSVAYSSKGQDEGTALLKVRRVTTKAVLVSNTAVGFTFQLPTRRPLAGASVIIEEGRRVARTRANGAFRFNAPPGEVRIHVDHPEYHPSPEQSIPPYGMGRKPLKFELSKIQFGFGDVVEVIPHPDPGAIAFLGTNLVALSQRFPHPTNCLTLLQPVDLEIRKVLPPMWEFSVGDHLLTSLTQCDDRVLGTLVYPGGIWDLDLGRRKHSLVTKPTLPNGREIEWPTGSAYDGRHLWIVERNLYTKPWTIALHALDPRTLAVKYSLPHDRERACALAWDADSKLFWISSLEGRVYSVRRDVALRDGKIDPARLRSFPGLYSHLAWSPGFLWGVDPEGKQICKIKITD